MLVSYARTSTTDQLAGMNAQRQALLAAGCEQAFEEQVSALDKRPQLEAALSFVRRGDSLVVTKLDRLARSTQHLLSIVESLDRKGVTLIILDFGGGPVDTSRATDKLLITVFGAFSEFERNLMLERQREGIARAKSLGRYQGRKPTARAKGSEVVRLAAEGVKRAEIARLLGISDRSVFRVLAASRPPKE